MEEAIYAPRIKLITDACHVAQVQARLPSDFDIDLIIDALYGAIWYKVLIRFEEVTENYVKSLIAQTLKTSGFRNVAKYVICDVCVRANIVKQIVFDTSQK